MKIAITTFVLALASIGMERALADPPAQSICDMPRYRGTAIWLKYCASSNPDSNEESQAAQQAAAATQKRHDALIRERGIRAADEKRQAELERQHQFESDRDAAAGTLRGSIGTHITSNGAADQLRGDQIDTGIRDLKPAAKARNLGGAHAAWKQLNCAAAISSDALAALFAPSPDYDEFRYLSGEAINALHGSPKGVACPATVPMPAAYGREGYQRSGQRFEALLEQGMADAERLGAVRAKRKSALDELVRADSAISSVSPASKSETDLSKLRAAQLHLNQEQDAKYAGARAQQRDLNAVSQAKGDAAKSAMAQALAAQRAAQSQYSANTNSESSLQRRLRALQATSGSLATGGSASTDVLKQLDAR